MTSHRTTLPSNPRPESAPAPGPPPFHHRPVLAVAAALVLLLLSTADRYGYHSDELYFRAAGQQLDWGYVDQPPLVPLLARTQTELLGDSPTAIRVAAALLAGACVLLAGLIAREAGGRGPAQLLAALATGVSASTLAYGHMLTPGSVDTVVWMAAVLLLLRMLNTGERWLWLPIGAVLGIGMLAKSLVPLLALGLLIGLLRYGPRSLLRTGWLLGGAAAGLLITLPNLVWQAVNGWPQITMARALSESGGMPGRVELIPAQLLLLGPFLAPLWVAGLVALLRHPGWRTYRVVAGAYLAVLLILILLAGQPRYLTGLLQVLLVFGCVAAVRWAGSHPRRAALGSLLVANALVAAVIALPLAPAAWHRDEALEGLSDVQTQQMGWPEYARQVARVHASLPAAERRDAVIVAGNYAEAGALDRYGPELGLPPVYSGHNSYHDLGRPPEGTGVVLLAGLSGIPADQRPDPRPYFRRCEPAGPLTLRARNPWQHEDVLVCEGPRTTWAELWPKLRWLGIP
ncbi:ArnT family glycosyltransferase [Streptomyces sp. NPDC057552]|uniref:ArnT family glycosyltransferase n=1 Tax=Streptomyces sp. NPDC057552 TaxID=3350537 RepID=UPI0036C1F89B